MAARGRGMARVAGGRARGRLHLRRSVAGLWGVGEAGIGKGCRRGRLRQLGGGMGKGRTFCDFLLACRCLVFGRYDNCGGFWRIYCCDLLLTSFCGNNGRRL